MQNEYDICPTCKSDKFRLIGVDSSSGHSSLAICGSFYGLKLNVCKDCGTVYVSKRYLDRIKED